MMGAGLENPLSGAASRPSFIDGMLAPIAGAPEAMPDVPSTPGQIFSGYLVVFVVAFLVTVLATPVMRMLAVKNGVVDQPSEARKVHRIPIAYLGGVAVYLGLLAAIAFSYVFFEMNPGGPLKLLSQHESAHDQLTVPFSILLGMTVIMITGLIDDVVGLDPRLKIAGQLLAAAALAMENVGTKVAAGVMLPVADAMGIPTVEMVSNGQVVETLGFVISMPGISPIPIDFVYWVGTAIIAIGVLGACNASNLIDGLDGLLSGVTAIAAAGLLIIALAMAANDDGHLDGSRIVLAMAVLGACLGFLPHNFNPATIFLGDCGSLLLGYMSIAVILTMGDTGKTHLVVAGLIIYAIPIIDTALAIIRRKMAGKPMSAPDDQHLHHMLKRALGVKGAAFAIYGIGTVFAALGVWLSMGRLRVVFTVALVVTVFIWVTAVKVARRQAIELAATGGKAPSGKPKHQHDEPESGEAAGAPASVGYPEPEPASP